MPPLFTQLLFQTQITENIKAPRDWPLCGEFTGAGGFPAQRPVTREMFPFDDVIMLFEQFNKTKLVMGLINRVAVYEFPL